MSQLTGVGIVNFVNVLPTISEGNMKCSDLIVDKKSVDYFRRLTIDCK